MNRYQQLFKELQKEKVTDPSSVDDHIMVFDGLNTFIRAFGATPSTNEDGDHVGGITGFLFSIGKAIRDFKPSRCVIVFDGRGGSARRKKIYGDYKANRANKTKWWKILKQVESLTRGSNLPIKTGNRKSSRLFQKKWRAAYLGDEQIFKTRRHALVSEKWMWNKKQNGKR